jgi:hypothetical protein
MLPSSRDTLGKVGFSWTFRAGLAGVVALASCTSLSGLSDGSDAAADGGPAGIDGSPSDAGADVLLPDAHWCERQSPAPLFCSDFDTEPFTAPWDPPWLTGGSALSADFSVFTSPPASLLTSLPQLTTDGRARVCKTFPHFPAEAHLAFDLQVDQVGTPQSAGVASIRLNDPKGTLYTDLIIDAAGWKVGQSWQLNDGGSPAMPMQIPLTETPAASTWTRVKLDLALAADGGASSATVRVSFGDRPVAETAAISADIPSKP